MAKTVTSSQEILLNNYKYKINGKVVMEALSPFPERQSIGDDSYDNKLHLSNYTISDLRGGIGVEEMDEDIDWNRCWWTDCIIKYKNHILPPRLATAVSFDDDIASAATILNADMELAATGWTAGTRSGVQKHGGSYSYQVDDNTSSYQDASTFDSSWQGKIFTAGAWVWSDGAIEKIEIYDGTDTTSSSSHSGGSGWEYLEVTHTMNGGAARLRVQLTVGNTGSDLNYFDDVLLGSPVIGSSFHFAQFNGELYVATGAMLSKLKSGRASFEIVLTMPTTVTALIPSLNSRLYVYLGDDAQYRSMTTAEAFTITTNAAGLEAYWGWQFDNKLFKSNTSGTVKYSTDPESATPTWSAGGTITDIASQIESFTVGRDAAGSPQSYCATNSVLKVLDLDTPEWVDTEVKLPNHPIGGQGFTYFNGKLYLSYGLAIKEYYAETGFVRDIGLTERDGLPVEYNGEVTKLLGDSGLEVMFVGVDASVTSGNSKSGLYAWDGGWQCWWVDTANNGAIYDIIVSSAESGYAVYWAIGSKIYYIDIPRGIQNPDKISQSYGTAGIFVSPWFDAGNAAADKLAKSLSTFTRGVTSTETIALKYRIDHTCGDLDSGWTTMDTLNTVAESGTNEELFASGVGESVNAIQFRLDFVTAGSTAKADMQAMVFYYKKRTGGETVWSWVVPIVVDNEGQTSAKEKWENLKAAKDSATDVLFSYHPNDASTESYYVSVDTFTGTTETGRRYEGNYTLRLIQV